MLPPTRPIRASCAGGPPRGRTRRRRDSLPARSRLTAVLLALAAITAAVGLAACGGGDGGGSADARQVVKQTFAGQKRVDSGKLDLSLTAKLRASGLAASQLKEPIVLRMSGPFQSRGENELPAMDLQLAATGSGQDFSAGAISTGTKGYVSFQGKPYTVPDDVFNQFKTGFERQQRQDKSRSNLDLNALGIDPENWLENPKNEGTEEVSGTETTHVSSDVDLDALLNDVDDLLKRADKLDLSRQQLQELPKGLTGANRRQIKDAIKKAKVDIWTGKDDKTLRRLDLQVTFVLPERLKEQAQGVEGGDVKLTLAVSDVNQKQDIKPPANPRPWSELQQQFESSALGSLGGSSGSGSSSGSGTAGSGSKRTQKYLKCVRKAKTTQAVQKCGSILGG
jgi:hypothetical protein